MRILLSLVLLLTLVEYTTAKRSTSCKPGNHRYYRGGRCKRCPKCGPGKGLDMDIRDISFHSRKNQALTCFKCVLCEPGLYSDRRGYESCQNCSDCSILSRVEEKSCSPDNDAVCGECQPMYYDFYEKKLEIVDVKRPCQHCKLADHSVPECAEFVSLQTSTVESPATSPNLTQSPVVSPPIQPQIQAHAQLPPRDPPAAKPTHPNSGTSVGNQGYPVYMLLLMISVITVFAGTSVTVILIWLRRNPKPSPRRNSQTPRDTDITEGTSQEMIELAVLSHSNDSSISNRSNNKIQEDGPDVSQPLLTEPRFLTFEQKYLIRGVGQKWRDLACELGLTDANLLNNLEEQYGQNLGETIHQMLLQWERTSPTEANVQNAYRALKSIRKTELASKLYAPSTKVKHRL